MRSPRSPSSPRVASPPRHRLAPPPPRRPAAARRALLLLSSVPPIAPAMAREAISIAAPLPPPSPSATLPPAVSCTSSEHHRLASHTRTQLLHPLLRLVPDGVTDAALHQLVCPRV